MAGIKANIKIRLLEMMVKSRKFEETLIEMMTRGEVAGWFHPMLGQEAVGVGVAACLKRSDSINNTHRGRAISIAKGVPLKRFMAEVLGKEEGPCRGMAGEMHYCDAEYGILGSSGILGATIPIAVGVAMANKYMKSGQVVVSVFGDGTVDEGNFHESINIASVWKLPMVFIAENNEWAQFTPQKMTAAQPEIWRKAKGYNMPGIVVDGLDVLSVYETTNNAVARARRGDGPTLIECKCSRWMGHYIGDPQAYRDKKDIERAEQADPLKQYEERLLNERIVTQDDIRKIEEAVMGEINEAVEYAKELSAANIERVFNNVYAEGDAI